MQEFKIKDLTTIFNPLIFHLARYLINTALSSQNPCKTNITILQKSELEFGQDG